MSSSRPVTRGRSSASAPVTPSRTSKRLQNLAKQNYTGLDLTSTDSQPYEQSDESDDLGSPMDTSSDVESPLPASSKTPQLSAPAKANHKTQPAAFSYLAILPDAKVFIRDISQLSREAFRSTLLIAYDVPQWTDERMSAYIDSLLRNFKFNSALYFNKVSSSDRKAAITPKRVILKGHLQLKALELFMNGQIPCHDSFNRPWFFCNMPETIPCIQRSINPDRLVLSSEIKEQFKKLQIECFEFDNVPKHTQDELRSYLVPGMGLSLAGTFQQRPTSIVVTKETGESNSNPDNSQIRLEPQASEDWIDFAKTLDENYLLSDRLHLDKDAAQSTILACLATMFEIGRASSESRTPGYRTFETLKSRSLSTNRLFITNKAFERFSSFLPDDVTSISNATMLLSQAEAVAVFALVYHFMDVCDDQQLMDHVIALRSSHRRTSKGEDVSNEQLWAVAWETIQSIESAGAYRETRNAKVIGGSHPCKPCSDANKTCDRRRPRCGGCARRKVHCEWLSLTDINRRRTEEACLECKEKHRACDRKRPTCDMCRTRDIECHWAEKSMHEVSAKRDNTTNAGGKDKEILDCITVSEGTEQKRKATCTKSPQLTKRPKVSPSSPSMTTVAQEVKKTLRTEGASVKERTAVLPQHTKSEVASALKPRSKSPDSVILSDSSDDEPLSLSGRSLRPRDQPLLQASSAIVTISTCRTEDDCGTSQPGAANNNGAGVPPKTSGGTTELIRDGSGKVTPMNNTEMVSTDTVHGLHALNKATMNINTGVDFDRLNTQIEKGSSLLPPATEVEATRRPVVANLTRNAIDARGTPMASGEESLEATRSGQCTQAKAIEKQNHTKHVISRHEDAVSSSKERPGQRMSEQTTVLSHAPIPDHTRPRGSPVEASRRQESQEKKPILKHHVAQIVESPIEQSPSPTFQRGPSQVSVHRSDKASPVSQSPDSAKPTKPMSAMMQALARKREKRAQEERNKRE